MDEQERLAKMKAQMLGQDNNISPSDENQQAGSLRNFLVSKLGLPQDWQQSVADEKRYYNDLPMNIGMGTMGRIGAPIAQEANVAKAAAPQVAERFPTIKKMFQIGDKVVPAESTAHALEIKNALVKTGQAEANAVIQALDSNSGYGFDSIPKK